jgi:hypothetical protein
MAASAQVNSRMQHVISTPSNGTGYIDFGVNIFLDMGIGADDCCGLASRLLEHHRTSLCKENFRKQLMHLHDNGCKGSSQGRISINESTVLNTYSALFCFLLLLDMPAPCSDLNASSVNAF